MGGAVTIRLRGGEPGRSEFRFDERTRCLIGRARDCQVRIADSGSTRGVSRFHCVLEINPPTVRLRDFGSRNGTWLNGRKIGQRAKTEQPGKVDHSSFAEFDIADGDVIKVGECELEVAIVSDQATAVMPAPVDSEVAELLGEGATMPAARPAASSDNFELAGYELKHVLGTGGMGRVYLGENTATGQQIAIKTLIPEAAANDYMRGMFMREVQLSQRLSHPNIVSVYELGLKDGLHYFCLEYCDSGNVGDLVDKRGPLPLDVALPYAFQMLDALRYAHAAELSVPDPENPGQTVTVNGVVHRDIKPDNLFLASQGDRTIAKLADFGLAKAFDMAGLSGMTATGTGAGTPTYMPRQQLLDYKYAKPSVDVWAAAATLYTMLTGATPRDFVRGQDPWLTVLQTAPVPVAKRNPKIPPRLAEVLDEALVDQPDLRVTSAAQLTEMLKGAL